MSNQYRSILKATTIFGGTQLFQILFNLLRSKSIALLVGVMGMGMTTMYNTSLNIIITLFGMGINVSVVNQLTKAYDDGDNERISVIVSIFQRLTLLLAGSSVLFVCACSPLLSKLSFDEYNHTGNYCLLSLIVVTTLLQQCNTAILVSMRKIKDIAISSVLSSFATLIVSVPFFYFLRYDGIVPGLIFSSLCNWLITWFFVKRLRIKRKKVSKKIFTTYSYQFISLGMAMVLSSLIGAIAVYGINVFVVSYGEIDDIGLYSAAMAIVTQSVVLVFSSMSSDYYPRLLTSLKDKDLMNSTVNQQTEIIILIASPILMAMIYFSPLVIKILLSQKFLVMAPLMRILCIGMFLKACSYTLGYVSLAFGEKKVYTFLEGIYGNAVTVILSIMFYYFFGLNGLGYAVVVDFLLYYIVISLFNKYRYGYLIDRGIIMLLAKSFGAILLLFFMSQYQSELYFYIFGGILLAAESLYCLILLKRKISI